MHSRLIKRATLQVSWRTASSVCVGAVRPTKLVLVLAFNRLNPIASVRVTDCILIVVLVRSAGTDNLSWLLSYCCRTLHNNKQQQQQTHQPNENKISQKTADTQQAAVFLRWCSTGQNSSRRHCCKSKRLSSGLSAFWRLGGYSHMTESLGNAVIETIRKAYTRCRWNLCTLLWSKECCLRDVYCGARRAA
jgi:hypothetical protein